jgi:hypothetical protein
MGCHFEISKNKHPKADSELKTALQTLVFALKHFTQNLRLDTSNFKLKT